MSALIQRLSLSGRSIRFSSLSLKGLWSALAQMQAVSRQRKALADLDPDLLDDIGVTASEARIEAQRPAWDVRASWTR
ncbi:hypothetical protein AQS8620_02595 [Aquimixticola soesokkakensis]|uniref:YjiS-like domain-containing protein n=1 Tax=Aquimixticola soesokkakensis TaxID=1519096 RepID=A0A1Y5T928_9RHOB|nr:DUF1127 domain-containing protein [Aquimixticola soesokkakensis]SLN58484.1 hypothetical protein AQS8620_02595 [Aquimixticola soesokkakensis]